MCILDRVVIKRGVFIRTIIAVVVGIAGSGVVFGNSASADPPTVGYRPGWPVDVGLLVDRSSPAVGNLDGDVELEVVVGTRGRKVYAFNPNGSAVPGWPVQVSAEVNSSPAIGDIDGDGWNEVVVGAGWEDLQNDGGIYAFNHNGQLLPGWPVRPKDENQGHNGHPDGVFSSPALVDLDGDGLLDVVVPTFDQYLYALRYDGTHIWGGPLYLWDGTWSSPAVGDLDQDGDVEIVVGTYTHQGFPPGLTTVDGGGIIWLFNADGTVASGWPRVFDLHFDSSPALGDLDGDGDLEIVIGTGHEVGTERGHHVYAFHHDGTDVTGWPVSTGAYVWPSPALGDLDGDGLDEVVISCIDGYLYAWDGNGTSLPGWPVRPLNESGLNGGMVGSPVVVDLDGNGDLEVMVPIGWDLVAFNHNGSFFRYGSETQLRLRTLFGLGGTPTVADIDRNGRLDVLIGSAESSFYEGRLYAWELPAAATPGKAPWPMFRRDVYRSGRVAVAPELAASLDSLFLLHEYGSALPESVVVQLANEGEGSIEWTVTFHPSNITITPLSGVLDLEGQTITITVSVAGYGEGIHFLGYVEIVGRMGGKPVNGSPIRIPVVVYVGTIHRVFLPGVFRGQ